jgi:hypothetical protein
MTSRFLDHPLLFSGTLFVVLVIAVESGFRLAVLSGAAMDQDRREQIAASRDSLGILLSLLLGFTLAMALPRFDLRKQLVLDEANAIGTASLRAELLPQAQRVRARTLLLEYVAARQAYSRAALGQQELTTAINRTKSAQSSLWQIAQESARQSPTPITALFVSSLNEVIDLSEKRLTALENRIPPTIWLMLLLIALLTCFTFGYWQRKRFWLVAVITPLMIAIVMGLIADLDSPRSGFLRVDLRSLERVEQDLRTLPSVSHAPSSDTQPTALID